MPPGASGPTQAAEHVGAEHDGSMRGHPDEPGRNDNGTSARAVRAVRHQRPNEHQKLKEFLGKAKQRCSVLHKRAKLPNEKARCSSLQGT
eukprot:SM000069S20695  [mRNA]  locus=s69:254694:283318:- [translate_table: standard]